MRAEHRGRITLACWRVNRWSEGAGEQAEAVCNREGGGLGGISQGQGQQRGRWGRRGIDRGVREGPQGEPLQALESDVLGELFPTPGPEGGDPEAGRAGSPDPRGAHRGRQDRSNGRKNVLRAHGGTAVPPGLVRIPAGAIGAAGGGALPGAVLEG